MRRARAQWYSVKSELEHELASDELKRSLHDGREALREARDQLRDVHDDIGTPARLERAGQAGQVDPPATAPPADRNDERARTRTKMVANLLERRSGFCAAGGPFVVCWRCCVRQPLYAWVAVTLLDKRTRAAS